MTQVRRFWNRDEDQALTQVIHSMDTLNWTLVAAELSELIPLANRTPKQCRQRWLNNLNKSDTTISWSKEEEKKLVELFTLHHQEKTKWKSICSELTAVAIRHPHDVKNRFYALIRRALRRINNYVGKEINPQQIRTLKPKTISEFLEQKSNQDCQKLANIIYLIASEDCQQTFDQEFLKNFLKDVMEVGRVISRKKEETVEEKTNKKSRKLSSETKASEVEEFDELRQSGVTLRSSQAQEAIYEEQDIGCFLNIGLVESPVLEFEDLQFTF